MSWKNVQHLWLLFTVLTRNDEQFWKPFGLTENILGEPSEFLFMLGFEHPPFQVHLENKHDAHMKG